MPESNRSTSENGDNGLRNTNAEDVESFALDGMKARQVASPKPGGSN